MTQRRLICPRCGGRRFRVRKTNELQCQGVHCGWIVAVTPQGGPWWKDGRRAPAGPAGPPTGGVIPRQACDRLLSKALNDDAALAAKLRRSPCRGCESRDELIAAYAAEIRIGIEDGKIPDGFCQGTVFTNLRHLDI